MRSLPSLHANANVAVIGASGGIGRAFLDALCADPGIATVHALGRRPVETSGPKLSSHPLDLTDEASIRDASGAASVDAPLDLVIVASGILHRADAVRPEKSMRELDPAQISEVMAINTIGPALAAKHFLPTLRRRHKTVFAALSARVGSIGDNRLGGWSSYRASKAALNMMIRTLAIEQARRWPDSVVVALHPGTVDTPLSKPFTSQVPASRLFDPATAAAHLLRVIENLTPNKTGGFFAWDGAPIGY